MGGTESPSGEDFEKFRIICCLYGNAGTTFTVVFVFGYEGV